jgi:hypothetical protein
MLIQLWLDMPLETRIAYNLQVPEENCDMTRWLRQQKIKHESLSGDEAVEFDFKTMERITKRPEWHPIFSYHGIKYAEKALSELDKIRLQKIHLNYIFKQLDNPNLPDDKRKVIGFIMSAVLPYPNKKDPDQLVFQLTSEEINWILVIEAVKRELFNDSGKLIYSKIFDGTYVESLKQ